MKKSKVIFLPVFLMSLAGLYNGANAQCCNVFASNGTAVTTSGATCVALSYPTTVCEEILVEIITVDVWMFYDQTLADVRFHTASDELTNASYRSLDKVVDAMKSSNYTLKVSGYADSVGTDEYNKDLSTRRALAVKKYLVEHGVSENKIALASYGENMPKAANRTKRGRSMNRRVEFDLY